MCSPSFSKSQTVKQTVEHLHSGPSARACLDIISSRLTPPPASSPAAPPKLLWLCDPIIRVYSCIASAASAAAASQRLCANPSRPPHSLPPHGSSGDCENTPALGHGPRGVPCLRASRSPRSYCHCAAVLRSWLQFTIKRPTPLFPRSPLMGCFRDQCTCAWT